MSVEPWVIAVLVKPFVLVVLMAPVFFGKYMAGRLPPGSTIRRVLLLKLWTTDWEKRHAP